ncbi:hypothetical protein BGZ97_008459 [Linnemannia gamsii]|uniref:Uncharacterized protein n=1 Tax=Linnemannia gamsii TaxID=64522 RepID=A0A9P6UDK4_9FUNG|nr:hypothetical protein BGZ97_008459 [Linnemannia gamsii]
MDWIVRQLNKPEVFGILQNPEPCPPHLIPTWHTFQQLANGINHRHPSRKQAVYTMQQVKTKIETIKTSFKRGQDLIQNSGYKSAQISDSLRKLVLQASPYYFKLEANWSKAWSDPVQDGCVSTTNHGDKTVNSSTRTGTKAALRPSAKADGGEVEQTTEEEISRNASKNNKDKDAMDARSRKMKHSEVRVQKGKVEAKKQVQKESLRATYPQSSERPLPKKPSNKVLQLGSSSQTSISAPEGQGSMSKAQSEGNNSLETGFSGDGSDRMQSLTEAVPITLKDDKKIDGEAELLIMKHRLALKEIEAKDKEDARRAATSLEERWMELEMQRVNNEHLIRMAQLQKEKDIEIHKMSLEFWFEVGVDCFSFSQVKDIKHK